MQRRTFLTAGLLGGAATFSSFGQVRAAEPILSRRGIWFLTEFRGKQQEIHS